MTADPPPLPWRELLESGRGCRVELPKLPKGGLSSPLAVGSQVSEETVRLDDQVATSPRREQFMGTYPAERLTKPPKGIANGASVGSGSRLLMGGILDEAQGRADLAKRILAALAGGVRLTSRQLADRLVTDRGQLYAPLGALFDAGAIGTDPRDLTFFLDPPSP